jgi:hypothetical protein
VEQGAPDRPEASAQAKEIWAIRVRMQLSSRIRDLAMFNLAIDSKLRACDLTKLRVRDVCHGVRVASRATIMQQKTQRPAQFEDYRADPQEPACPYDSGICSYTSSLTTRLDSSLLRRAR